MRTGTVGSIGDLPSQSRVLDVIHQDYDVSSLVLKSKRLRLAHASADLGHRVGNVPRIRADEESDGRRRLGPSGSHMSEKGIPGRAGDGLAATGAPALRTLLA
jgi:hypothetical protein